MMHTVKYGLICNPVEDTPEPAPCRRYARCVNLAKAEAQPCCGCSAYEPDDEPKPAPDAKAILVKAGGMMADPCKKCERVWIGGDNKRHGIDVATCQSCARRALRAKAKLERLIVEYAESINAIRYRGVDTITTTQTVRYDKADTALCLAAARIAKRRQP
jgi:hypothetical protein